MKCLINGGVAKPLGNMYIKFDILAMLTRGENKSFLNCLHLWELHMLTSKSRRRQQSLAYYRQVMLHLRKSKGYKMRR